MAWPTSIQNFFALIPHKVEIRTACIRYGPRCRLRVTPIYRLTRKRCIRQNKQRLLEDRAVCATYLHLIDTSRSVAALRRLVNHQLDVTGIDRGKGVDVAPSVLPLTNATCVYSVPSSLTSIAYSCVFMLASSPPA